MLSFSNGNVINLGNIKGSKGDKGDKGDSGLNGKDGVGIQNVDVSADGALTVTLTNGTVLNLGNIKGADGLGITKAEINTSGELVLTYSNGDVKNLGKVSGENGKDGADGADGLGIKSLTLSPDGELVVTMSDNSISNLGNIKGDKGDRGEQGQQGLQGTKGADGRGIAKTELVNGELVITYTDGTSDNLGKITSDNYVTTDQLNFTYSLLDSGTYKITGLSERGKTLDIINIPAKIDGKDVTEIAEDAFYSNHIIKKVKIPNTVTTIGARSFFDCRNLSEVNIPNSVKTINNRAFALCKSLTLTIPDSVERIEDAFIGMNKGSVTFDKSKYVVESCRVSNCSYEETPFDHEYAWSTKNYVSDYIVNIPLEDWTDNESLLYTGLDLYNCTFGPYTVSGTKQKITVDCPILIKKIIIPKSITTIKSHALQISSGIEIFFEENST